MIRQYKAKLDITRTGSHEWTVFYNGKIFLIQIRGLMARRVINNKGVILYETSFGGNPSCEEWIRDNG